MDKALTPKEKKKRLKKRLALVVPQLAKDRWMGVFITFYPDYEGQERLLSNVKAGRSLDEGVISKMEEMVKKIKELKSNNTNK